MSARSGRLVLLSLGLLSGAPACGTREARVRLVGFEELQASVRSSLGRGTLVALWAMWWTPCKAELPGLVAVADEFRGRGGVVLTVSYDLQLPDARPEEVLPRLERFVAERGLDFRVFLLNDEQSRLDEAWDLPGPIPVTLALDADGRIVDREEGQADRRRLEEMMRKALGD